MEEKEFITMLEDLIYAEQELSDDYYKATNKAIDLLDKLKAKQLILLVNFSHRRELLLAAICEYNKFNTQEKIMEVDKWVDNWDSK